MPQFTASSVRGKDLLGISQDTHPGSRLHGSHTCSSALWVLGGLPRPRTKGASCPGLRHGVRTQVSGLWPLLFLHLENPAPHIFSCSDLMHVSASVPGSGMGLSSICLQFIMSHRRWVPGDDEVPAPYRSHLALSLVL